MKNNKLFNFSKTTLQQLTIIIINSKISEINKNKSIGAMMVHSNLYELFDSEPFSKIFLI